MDPIIIILIILVGLALGSFLNVCIYRIPQKKSLLLPGSFCPKCKTKISYRDNIPILGFILLGGKCRNCHEKISLQYPLVEFITPLLLFLTYWRFGLTWGFAARSILTLVLIATFFIDLQHRIIPDVLTLPGIIVGFLLSFLVKSPSFVQSLLGIAVGGGMFYLAAILGDLIFKKESMGGGDIKLAAMLGAFLGWQKIFLVFFVSALLGSLIGIISLYLSKEVKKTHAVPFGTFLALGAIITVFFGDTLISFYIKTFLRY
jgi:leader peptidase (prepilin peptidase)/N-methyltransferase